MYTNSNKNNEYNFIKNVTLYNYICIDMYTINNIKNLFYKKAI